MGDRFRRVPVRIPVIFLWAAVLAGGCRPGEASRPAPAPAASPDPSPGPSPALAPEERASDEPAAPVARADRAETGGAAAHGLEVHVIDVGQGDAIFIRCPDGAHQMLIDAGDTRYPGSKENFRAFLTEHQARDDPIEVVIATHPHADHIGSMAWVLSTYHVLLYVDNGQSSASVLFRQVAEALAATGTPHRTARDARIPDIDFCPLPGVTARILRPAGFGRDSDPNEDSVVVRVDYGAEALLFMGDAGVHEEKLLLNDPDTWPLLRCAFLKVGHHGSDTASSPEFVAAVQPDIVAISCGAPGVGTNAGYRHPRQEAVEVLEEHAANRAGAPVSISTYDSSSGAWVKVSLHHQVYATSGEGSLEFDATEGTITKKP